MNYFKNRSPLNLGLKTSYICHNDQMYGIYFEQLNLR